MLVPYRTPKEKGGKKKKKTEVRRNRVGSKERRETKGKREVKTKEMRACGERILWEGDSQQGC